MIRTYFYAAFFLSLFLFCNLGRVINSRRLRSASNVGKMEQGKSAFKLLTGKPSEKRALARLRRRWENNIK